MNRCLECKVEIKTNKKFCGQSCSGKYNGKRNSKAVSNTIKDLYNKDPIFCLKCDKSIEYEKRFNRFCDNSCSAIYNNSLREKKKCGFCNRCFNSDYAKQKFCSTRCSNSSRKQSRLDAILKSGVLYKSSGQARSAKQYLIKIRGHKCEICGLTEWRDKKAPLVMDHINGDSTNNKLINLRLVCGNCDMQLPTYKAKNKGKGRKWRKKRYQEGKSY